MNNTGSTSSIRFCLAISAEKYLAFYQGNARDVVVRSEDNRSIRFPAGAIQSFLTHDGVFGRFEISFDKNNKLIGVERIS